MADASSSPGIAAFRWVGCDEPLLDMPTLARCGRVAIGRYGGSTRAGAAKNEDAALVWCVEDGAWEFAALLDAHYSCESAVLVLDAIEGTRAGLVADLARPIGEAFAALQARLLALFAAPDFRARCRAAEGEASCLIFARKGPFLWWLAIGDCVGYLLHPELARFGQYAVNQRSFYEWVGARNTFDRPVPCYTAGTRALSVGASAILMATDGLLECGPRTYENPAQLYKLFAPHEGRGGDEGDARLDEGVRVALEHVRRERGRDSATILAWRFERRVR